MIERQMQERQALQQDISRGREMHAEEMARLNEDVAHFLKLAETRSTGAARGIPRSGSAAAGPETPRPGSRRRNGFWDVGTDRHCQVRLFASPQAQPDLLLNLIMNVVLHLSFNFQGYSERKRDVVIRIEPAA
jgi:hypothetical protein